MKDKGIYYTLLLIVAVGITITTCTNYFLGNSSKTKAARELTYEQEMEEEIMAFSDNGGEPAMHKMAEDDTMLEEVIAQENQDARTLGVSEEGQLEESEQKRRSMDSEKSGRASKEIGSELNDANAGEAWQDDRLDAAKAEAVLISPLETAPLNLTNDCGSRRPWPPPLPKRSLVRP